MENIQSEGAASAETYDINIDNLDVALKAEAGDALSRKGGEQETGKAGAEQVIEIDEQFKGLPEAEARARTIQSRYDTLQTERDKFAADLQEAEPYKNFVNQIMTDENMLIALVNKVKPGLIPKMDVSADIKARLKEQFGEEFKPELSREESERQDPGGTDWQYYKKLDDITTNATKGDPQHELTIEQYKKKIDAEREAGSEAAKVQIEAAKKEFNATAEEITAISEFGNKLEFRDLVRIHRFLRKFSSKTSGIANVTGPAPKLTTDRENFLSKLEL